jgi:nuclease S1
MRSLLFTVLMAPLLASSAFGWGCEGHQIVALIARVRLIPAVSAAVDDLLRSDPIDPALTRFCKDSPKDLMADSASWADDTKNQEKTSIWHYIDIPRSADKVTSVDPWCPPIGPSVDGKSRPGCITNAIEYELGILRDKSRPAAERATALRYVIHFVGDIQQPLHDEDNDDQGGNCTAMRFFSEERPANLHAIWDYKLIQHQLEQDKLTQVQLAASLNDRFAAKYAAIAAAKPDDPTAWAWQAHAIAISNTYGNLDPAIPVVAVGASAGCNAERDKVAALHIVIGDAYYNKAIPVIDEQLATGGFRLAVLLNDVLR